jgi:hypothetical protein
MQNVAWPIAAKVSEWSLTIEAHSRGGEGRGGHYAYERGAGARWRGSLEVLPMATADACAFRAFLHSLRGKSGTFLWAIPAASAAISGTLTASASAGAETITVSSAVSGAVQCGPGAFLVVGDLTTTGQLVRVTGKAGSVLTIRPRLRAAYASGAAVSVGRVRGRFRLDQETPAVPLTGHRSHAVELDIAEAY